MAHDQKQEAIIKAALNRFAHYGVAKTTMSEIAADVSMSKASLYYYFPDKINLYAAVLQTIAGSTAKEGDELFDKEKDPYKAMNYFLERRTQFIIRFHNLLEYLRTFNSSKIPQELQPIFRGLHEVELQRLITIIQKGVDAGLFKVSDIKKTARLLHEFLDSFRTCFLRNNPDIFPEKKQFQSVLKKEMEFATIFLKGLTI
jgi:TetR/AcrR family transcriptional regulator